MTAGLYIHVPFCAQKCPYCDFYSGAYRVEKAAAYVDAVCRNIRALPEKTALDTVYLGGGTPSLLKADAIAQMLDTVRARCDLSPDAEITLECNPLTMTADKLNAWRIAGVNRLSVGVQSFDGNVLKILGRRHTPEQAKDAILRAYSCGYSNISLDLMLGLTVQTADRLDADIAEALALPVTHISAYLLKIEEGTPFGKHPPDMLSDDDMAARYMQLHDALTAAGYTHYEISNFARAGFASRHNCKYWRCEPYYAVGPAAHGCIDGVRYAVPPDLDMFLGSALQNTRILDENACGEYDRIMLGLRLSEGIPLGSVPQSRERLLQNAKPLIPRYVTQTGDRLAMTPEGWLLSNAVLCRLLDEIN